MSLIAIVGRTDNSKAGTIRGNGKTCAAVFLARIDYKNGRKIYTNFKTTFSSPYKINDLIEMFKDSKLHNVTVIIDEMQKYLNNSGIKVQTRKELITNFIAQSRKEKIDIIITTQRYKQIHVELRDQIDKVLLAEKYHYQKNKKSFKLLNRCKKDDCDLPHVIILHNESDCCYLSCLIDACEIGKMYNTNEIVLDDYNLHEEKTVMKKELQRRKIKMMSIEQLEKLTKN